MRDLDHVLNTLLQMTPRNKMISGKCFVRFTQPADSNGSRDPFLVARKADIKCLKGETFGRLSKLKEGGEWKRNDHGIYFRSKTDEVL